MSYGENENEVNFGRWEQFMVAGAVPLIEKVVVASCYYVGHY